METAALDTLKFPIGRFVPAADYDPSAVSRAIAAIEALPGKMRELAAGLSESAWDGRYRPGGWTLRQVVHHVADSHINAYVRFKLALTEENPIIKPYMEDRWAELPDVLEADPRLSLDFLAALHAKWTLCLRSMGQAGFNRSYFHPETAQQVFLFNTVASYAWHGEHHLAHLRLGRENPH
jgi:hypothetical protein